MLYAIIATDVTDSLERRRESRAAHLARLEKLRSKGRLILAGPHPTIDCPDPGPNGFSGSLIVAEFDTLSHAKDWAEADPYSVTGVYKQVVVKPFNQVLP